MNNNYNLQPTIYNLTPGFSLVEIILAIALFGLFATALLGLLMNSYASDFQAAEREEANLYARQGMEAVWSIRRQAWNLLENGDHGLANTSGHWQFSGSSDLLDDKYARVVTVADACRSGGDIVDCPSGTIDLHTKKAIVRVVYTAITGVSNQVELTSYLTTWQSKNFIQTDWSGGAGQSLWSDSIRYFSDDGNIDYGTFGEIKLANLGTGGCGTKVWPFISGTNYIFNSDDIEVTGGFAQLVNQGGGGAVSGATLNPDFNADTANWTYNDWNQGSGEVNVTGARQSSGGNPGGWVYINIPRGSRDELGGYWQQQFTTTVNDPTVTVDFDWQVTSYSPSPNTFQIYVFVDSSPGAPAIGQPVWSSGEITGTAGWTSQIDIDASSRVGAVGTYYLKIAVWVETPGSSTGPFTVGYDNVLLEWSGTAAPSYPSSRPDIYPDDSYDVSSIDGWSSFSETAVKNGGEIY